MKITIAYRSGAESKNAFGKIFYSFKKNLKNFIKGKNRTKKDFIAQKIELDLYIFFNK